MKNINEIIKQLKAVQGAMNCFAHSDAEEWLQEAICDCEKLKERMLTMREALGINYKILKFLTNEKIQN